MTLSTGKRRFHFKNTQPKDPAIQPFGEWSPVNRGFYARFRRWLKAGSYCESAVHIYGVAARLAIGFLGKAYWQIDPETDIEAVKHYLASRAISASSREGYRKGLNKFADFLRLSCHRPPREKEIPWENNIGSLSSGLQNDVREFLKYCQHGWKAEGRHERTCDKLYTLARPLRWIAEHICLCEVADLTPQVWYAYLDKRLESGISRRTVNGELSALKHFVYFLQEHERPVCERFLLLDYLEEGDALPKDIPIEQLRLLQSAIQADINSANAGVRRMGRMDLAWFLLMLHSGLRSGEVRNLKMADIEWQIRRVRIERSKGLKDRLVPLSSAAIQALQDYLEVRGPADALPENVFIFRHARLSRTYCFERMQNHGRRCGVKAAPHQLRHSCATLLLNSGAPVLTVQAILGHKQIDTTLGYARLYDGTVAADYYAAMERVERLLALPEDRMKKPPSMGQLIALVDALHRGTLNPLQSEIAHSLREGLSLMAEREQIMADIKVPIASTNAIEYQ